MSRDETVSSTPLSNYPARKTPKSCYSSAVMLDLKLSHLAEPLQSPCQLCKSTPVYSRFHFPKR